MPAIHPSDLNLDSDGFTRHQQPVAIGGIFKPGTPKPQEKVAWREVSRGEGIDDDPHDMAEAQMLGEGEDWKLWKGEIMAGLAHEDRWRKEALAAEAEYFGNPDEPIIGTTATRQKGKVHTVHANVDTIRPALYSQTPEPIIRRRHKDGKDAEKKALIAECAQRVAQSLIHMVDFDGVMEKTRDDWLIAGRGSAAIDYRAEFAEEIDPETQEAVEIKTDERIEIREQHWRRFIVGPASSWRQVQWIAYENLMTRKEIQDHPAMGDEVAANIGYNFEGLAHAATSSITNTHQNPWDLDSRETTGATVASSRKMAVVYEIWSKRDGKVIYWSPHYKQDLCGVVEDPLGLRGFFNGPEPLLATTLSGSMAPRPDIAYYLEHAKEIDAASKKLQAILDTIAITGAYAGSYKTEVEKLLKGQNTMVAVADWMALMEKGGVKGIIEWLPLEMLVTAAQALITMREQSKAVIYEITGISDIVRGQGDANETATAQEIKGRYAGLRMSVRQSRMARFSRDAIAIMLEIAFEHFDTQKIAELAQMDLPVTEEERQQIDQAWQMFEAASEAQAAMAQAQEQGDVETVNQITMQMIQQGIDPMQPPQQPTAERAEISVEAIQEVLRRDMTREYTIMIETDGTILSDETEDREARIEFLTAISGMVANLQQFGMMAGGDMKVMKELLLFAVRGFRKARTLESMIASLPDEVDQGEEQPPVELQIAQIRAEVDKMVAEVRAKADVDVAQINAQTDIQEQMLENDGRMQQESVRAAQKDNDRAQQRQLRGVELQAEAARMGAGA